MQIDFNSHVAKYTMFYSDFIVGKSYDTYFNKWTTSTKWYPNDQTAGSVLYEMIRMLYHNWEVYTTNEDAFGYSMEAILTANLRYYDEKLKKYQEEFNWKVSKLESIRKVYTGSEIKHDVKSETEDTSLNRSNQSSSTATGSKTINSDGTTTEQVTEHENTSGSIIEAENTSDNTSITETDDPHKVTETKYDLPRATASENRPSQIVETENEEHIKETEGNKTTNKESEVNSGGTKDGSISKTNTNSQEGSESNSLTESGTDTITATGSKNSGSVLDGNKTNNDNEEINYEGYNDLLDLRKKYLEQVQDLIKEFARRFQPLFLEVFA